MSEASEKPFEATAARIRKARREGNVARSSELSANLAFAAGALTLAGIMPIFAAATCAAVTSAAMRRDDSSIIWEVFALALLPAGGAAAAGTLAALVQNGGLYVISIAPKLERISPADGVKRILSRETLAHSLRALAAFALASAVMAPLVAWCAGALIAAPALAEVTTGAWIAVRQVVFAASAVGCCFAIAEHAAARRAWLRKLRMSFDERKREAKEEEGDATTRSHRRALHRTLLRGGMRTVKDAAFVVANPQHVAVALQYRPPAVPVPRVLVRAADAAAVRVRAIAQEFGIPVVENPVLARALYRDARAGQAIPFAHYVAVAEVVASLFNTGRIAES